MILGIGKVLCFHAKTGAMAGDLSALVASGAIQEVSAVKLDPRFCRKKVPGLPLLHLDSRWTIREPGHLH